MGNGRAPGHGGLPYSGAQRVWGGGVGGFTMGAVAGGGVVSVLLRILGESSGAETAIGRTTFGLRALLTTARNMSAAISAASLGAVAGIVALGEQGSRVLLVRDAWHELMTGMDIDGEKIMGTLDDVAKGQMSTTELMMGMNRAALLGGKEMAQELPALMAIASDSARRMGLSLADAFQYIVLGVGRASWMILDNLGITVDITKANERYADSLGVATKELTKAERITALLTAIKEKYGASVEAVAERAMYAAEKVAAFRAGLRNLFDEIKIASVPIIEKLVETLTPFIDILLKIPRGVLTAVLAIVALAAAFGAVAGFLVPIFTILTMLVTVGGGLSAIFVPLLLTFGALALVFTGMVVTGTALIAIWRTWALNLSDVQGIFRDLTKQLSLLGRDVIAYLQDTFGRIVPMIDALITGDWETLWNNLFMIVLNTFTMILVFWRRFVKRAWEHGRNLVVEFRNGMVQAFNTYLAPALIKMGNFIRRFLGATSPPEAGPLSEIVEWGRNLIDEFLRGFLLADFAPLREIGEIVKGLLDLAARIRIIGIKITGLEGVPTGADAEALAEAQARAQISGLKVTIETLRIYRQFRIELAQLIREWRETGEVNEEVMSRMIGRLGEGGEEVERLIRLWFSYQRAIENLKAVEKKVAEAREAGFIPAKLKEQLKTAEEQASAAEEAYRWQMEYLEALSATVDIQAEILAAILALLEAVRALKEEEEEVVREPEPIEPPYYEPVEPLVVEPFDFTLFFKLRRQEVLLWLLQTKADIEKGVGEWLKVIQDKLKPLRPFLEELARPWSRIFRVVLLESLRRFVENLDPAIIDSWRIAIEKVKTAASKLAGALGPLLLLLNRILAAIITGILRAFPGIATVISGILILLAGIVSLVSDAISSVVDLVTLALTEPERVKEVAREWLERFMEDFGLIGEGIVSLLVGIFETVGGLILGLLEGLGVDILREGETWSEVFEGFHGDLDKVREWLTTEFLPIVKQKLAEFGEAIKDRIGKGVLFIVNKFLELKDRALAFINEWIVGSIQRVLDFKDEVKKRIGELVIGVLDWFLKLKDRALARWEEIKTSVSTKVKEMKIAVLGWVEDLKTGFVTLIRNLWIEVDKAVKNLVETFIADVVELKTVLLRDVEELVGAFAEDFRSLWALLFGPDGAMTGLFQRFKDFFTGPNGLVARMKGWGRSLIQSFIDGIKDKFQALINVINRLRELWPFSPRAKRGPLAKPIDWSGYLTAGLPEALEVVKAAVEGSFSPAALSMAVAGAPGARGGDTYIYLVNPQFPGVRDGRDRDDFMGSVEEQVAMARLLAKVPGGEV